METQTLDEIAKVCRELADKSDQTNRRLMYLLIVEGLKLAQDVTVWLKREQTERANEFRKK